MQLYELCHGVHFQYTILKMHNTVYCRRYNSIAPTTILYNIVVGDSAG